MKILITMIGVVLLYVCWSSHKIEISTLESKPIHIVIDVNLKLQVDQELKGFFKEVDTSTEKESPKVEVTKKITKKEEMQHVDF